MAWISNGSEFVEDEMRRQKGEKGGNRGEKEFVVGGMSTSH